MVTIDLQASFNLLDPVVVDLHIEPQQQRWTHLSLCVLDAVHSIGVRYETVKKLCHGYAERVSLSAPLTSADETVREQPLHEFAEWAADLGEVELAERLNNHHRTSNRTGAPYKTRADIEYAQILVRHGIDLMADATALLQDPARLAAVETDLAKVPGHGLYDIRMNYLWMLVGADDRIKPDRMVLGWLEQHLARNVGVNEAVDLVKELAARHNQTPQALDHAIWLAQRERITTTGSCRG